MGQRTASRQGTKKIVSLLSITLLLLTMLLSACGADAQQQQQANKQKAELDKALVHAQDIGVPAAMLLPIKNRMSTLVQTNAPLALFSNQPANDYYANLTQNYALLVVDIHGVEAKATDLAGAQAVKDLQSFTTILNTRQEQGFVSISNFTTQHQNIEKDINTAKTPKDFANLSAQAKDGAKALQLMGTVNDQYNNLKDLSKQLKESQIDTTSLDKHLAEDLVLFRAAKSAQNFTDLKKKLDAQTQEMNTTSAQAMPVIGANKLKKFKDDIAKLKKYGGDTTTYQTQYDQDKLALDKAKNVNDYLKFSTTLDNHRAAIAMPVLKAEATALIDQLKKDTAAWGSTHTVNAGGETFKLGYEYVDITIYDLEAAFNNAQTAEDLQSVVDQATMGNTLFKAMKADKDDSTPYDQPHKADLDLMKHYDVLSGKVIVTSLVNQSQRVYENGKLIRSIYITSGQYERPSVPGFTYITKRLQDTKFKAFTQDKKSPFYYPDTKINYAMEYHAGEYYYHDSWWRADYGPGTQFPHYDSGGDPGAGTGSHGCINMTTENARWLFENTDYNTATIVY